MHPSFATILSGEDSDLIIAENEHFVVSLEKRPLVLGHVIVIARQPEDDLFQLPDAALNTLAIFSKHIARAIRQVIPCEKVGMAVIGLVARHAHLHLVPIHSADDLNFTRQKLSPSKEMLYATADRLRAAYSDQAQ